MKKTTLASLVGISLIPHVAQAAVIQTASTQHDATSTNTVLAHGYTVSTTDLLTGRTPVATPSSSDFQLESSGGVPRLTDGSFPSIDKSNYKGPIMATGGSGAGQSLTYTLAAPSTITSIDVYGGWGDFQRADQSYIVSYSVASDPTNFTNILASVSYASGVLTNSPGTNTPVATKVSLTQDDGSGILATNVFAVRFTFGNNVANTALTYSGYSEIDVNGFAVPEPSITLLGAIGVLGLIRRRR